MLDDFLVRARPVSVSPLVTGPARLLRRLASPVGNGQTDKRAGIEGRRRTGPRTIGRHTWTVDSEPERPADAYTRQPVGGMELRCPRVPARATSDIGQDVDLAGRAASVAGKPSIYGTPALRCSRNNRQALAQCV